mgnify:CR=1 FL=1|jgi:hypothetical protein
MSKIKPILFLLVGAFLMAACGGSGTEDRRELSPTETLRALHEASKKKDVEAIKSYLSKGTLDLLEQSARRRETSVDQLLREENGAPFQELDEMKNEQVSGETATVEVKNPVKGNFEKIPFVRENGVWKVALDKFMDDAIKRLTEEMKSAADSTPSAENVQNNTEKK